MCETAREKLEECFWVRRPVFGREVGVFLGRAELGDRRGK